MPATLTQLLGEQEGSVLVADILAYDEAQIGREPAELGIYLTSFYLHVGTIAEHGGGRIVKFVGDGIVVAFFGPTHARRALSVIAELDAARDEWLAETARMKFPSLDYSVGVASGRVLAGDLGTDRVLFFDVIGAPATRAFRLCSLAAQRKVAHLVDGATLSHAEASPAAHWSAPPSESGNVPVPPATEVEGAEVLGETVRIYRLGRLDGEGR